MPLISDKINTQALAEIDKQFSEENFTTEHKEVVETFAFSSSLTGQILVFDGAHYVNQTPNFSGTVNSISLTTPGVVFNTPVTFSAASGAWTGTLGLKTQTANTVFIGPSSGSAALPTFRALLVADLPDLNLPTLKDTTIVSQTDGQVLTYESDSGKWKNKDLPDLDVHNQYAGAQPADFFIDGKGQAGFIGIGGDQLGTEKLRVHGDAVFGETATTTAGNVKKLIKTFTDYSLSAAALLVTTPTGVGSTFTGVQVKPLHTNSGSLLAFHADFPNSYHFSHGNVTGLKVTSNFDAAAGDATAFFYGVDIVVTSTADNPDPYYGNRMVMSSDHSIIYGSSATLTRTGTGNSVKNLYGYYADVTIPVETGGTGVPYAFYSAGGKVRFGDLTGTGTEMVTVSATGVLGRQAIPSSGSSYTAENAQDDVGGILSSEFTYNDATPSIGINSIAQSKITNLVSDLAGKQAALVSGTNIKTVNGATLLGSGDMTVGNSTTVLSSAATSLTLSTYDYYTFSGSSTATWTLPAISGTSPKLIKIKNRGSAALTIQRAGTDQVYLSSAGTAVTLLPGDALDFVNDQNFWNIQ